MEYMYLYEWLGIASVIYLMYLLVWCISFNKKVINKK